MKSEFLSQFIFKTPCNNIEQNYFSYFMQKGRMKSILKMTLQDVLYFKSVLNSNYVGSFFKYSSPFNDSSQKLCFNME